MRLCPASSFNFPNMAMAHESANRCNPFYVPIFSGNLMLVSSGAFDTAKQIKFLFTGTLFFCKKTNPKSNGVLKFGSSRKTN